MNASETSTPTPTQQFLNPWLAFCDSQAYIHLNSGKTGLHPQTSIGILDGPRARFFVPNILAQGI
ncbi:hypothetical protein GGE09_000309 [Roseobacter sp. N2S]|nr:hypothetical protein [Roseobacter sp. N2S]